MSDFNSEIVKTTLKKVVSILEENNIKYCFIGSVTVAAINGRLHRKLGDLDLIVDASGKDILYKELTKLGYYRAGGMFTFARKYMSLETLDHKELLGVGYFYGNWKRDGSFVMGGKHITLTIQSHAIKPTKRILYGVNFISIPDRSVATGVNASKTNPKRKKEVILLKEKNINPFPNDYLQIRAYGMRLDWIYHLSMLVLNILGGVRVKMGLAFDPWR